MRARYLRCASEDGVICYIAGLSPKTVILDVEPIVARWNTGAPELDSGIGRFLDRLTAIPGIECIGFVTNSRRHALAAGVSKVRTFYVSSAHKPFRAGRYRGLPRPGVVIGDQLATDGILAWRLDFTFIHYCPRGEGSPAGVRIMHLAGSALRPLFFSAAREPR